LKKIKVTQPRNIDDQIIQAPVLDADAMPVLTCPKCGKVETGMLCEECKVAPVLKQEDADIAKLIDMFIRNIPRDKIAKFNDVTNGVSVMQTIKDCDNGELVFEDAAHTWLVDMLKENGVQMFSLNLKAVVDALEA
jgi:hypothetical protein